MTKKFVYDDGGRADAGYKGYTGDCVVRAIAIATNQPYKTIYGELNGLCEGTFHSSRTGIPRRVYEPYLACLGWEWVPTMKIGAGCTVHLKANELPRGIIICRLSKHMVTVIDGVIHDNQDPSREGTRCVYGYFRRIR